ncbi:complex I NDUFA9 subunit family protein [Acuticoccus mangrovi]|uniref:Complex I NDUFA9 subunit family protein n=1 Tax=Acuticoccus mangrovi TaxID=2796142 RepID=A0A934MGZ8_9HYPH|nr:complex I NDUFA9 subunit family protein [Acuticoccus mangrovi]MBJ3777133.1 complex I NDUFA9 subunit family protein [Acuticoccus mangrovi]
MERIPSKLVTVFGGSGFIGRYVVRELARHGWRVRVAVRRPDLVGHLQPMGMVGQIQPIQANVRDKASVAHAVSHVDAVVNLVGILAEGGKQTFEAVQAEGAANIAEAAKAAGIGRMVHLSAIGADPNGTSNYARTKAKGEAAVLAAMPSAAIVRPSVVFGPEDSFFNRFAGIAKISPILPIVGGETRFQPIYAGDVGAFVAAAVDGQMDGGTIYELGGPDVKTFRALMEMMLEITRLKRKIVEIPFGLAAFQAKLMSILPNAPLTVDQVELLKSDNVVSDAAAAEGRTLAAAGIVPHSLAVTLPTYLWTYRSGGQFAEPGSAS